MFIHAPPASCIFSRETKYLSIVRHITFFINIYLFTRTHPHTYCVQQVCIIFLPRKITLVITIAKEMFQIDSHWRNLYFGIRYLRSIEIYFSYVTRRIHMVGSIMTKNNKHNHWNSNALIVIFITQIMCVVL